MTLAQHTIEAVEGLLTADDGGPSVRYVTGGYRLDSDPDLRLVRIAISGFWEDHIARDFARDLLAEVRKVDSGENRHVILCDLSRAVIQSQGTFQTYRIMLLNGPTFARKFALVTNSLAVRMQARRILALRETIRLFEHQDEAIAWLMEGAEA